MRLNDRCALEVFVDGQWFPKALRHTKLSVMQKRALNQGQTIAVEGRMVRRYDWAELTALMRILRQTL